MPKKSGELRCALCSSRFDQEDVGNLSYFPDTSTCFDCYRTFSKAPFQGAKGTCFGKLNQKDSAGNIIGYGYDPIGSVDCSYHCPHRKICPLFANKTIYKLRKYLITPFKGETAKAMQLLLRGTTRLRAKTALSSEKIRKTLLRGCYEGKKWVVDRTNKIYKAYYVKTKGAK